MHLVKGFQRSWNRLHEVMEQLPSLVLLDFEQFLWAILRRWLLCVFSLASKCLVVCSTTDCMFLSRSSGRNSLAYRNAGTVRGIAKQSRAVFSDSITVFSRLEERLYIRGAMVQVICNNRIQKLCPSELHLDQKYCCEPLSLSSLAQATVKLNCPRAAESNGMLWCWLL